MNISLDSYKLIKYDINNIASLSAALNAGFNEEFRGEEEVICTKYSNKKIKRR